MTDPLTAGGLARFSEIASGFVARGEVPGVVAVVARGDQVHTTAAGTLSVGGAPVREDSIFRIASLTKPMTAAATLALAAEGLLRLDEPVGRLLPELAHPQVLRQLDGALGDTVPAQRAITIRDLLTFTFGFGGNPAMYSSPEKYPVVAAASGLHLSALGPPDPPDPAGGPDHDTWIARFGSLPLMAQPGERWLYHTGASVLGVLLARAAGQPFAEVLRTRVLDPLGMRDTGFWTSEAGRMATVCSPGPAAFDERGRDWRKPPAFCDGATGLVSTAGDLLAFSRMLLRGGSPVLAPEAVKEMTREQLTPQQKTGLGIGKGMLDRYGWGFCMFVATGGPRAGARWLSGSLGTTWLMNPQLGLTVIVMTQQMFGSATLPPVHSSLQAAAYSAVTPP